MTKMIRRPIVTTTIPAIAALILWTSSANAWNALGHKVVAEIAWRELDPAKRQNIVEALRRHPRFDADFAGKMTDDVLKAEKATQDRWIFQHAAYWPDIARGLPEGELEKYNRPTWHYVTNPLFLDGSDRDSLLQTLRINNTSNYPADIPPEEYNAYQAIAYCREVVASKAGRDVKAIAYCWLFHLVGDLHQPLHSTSLYSVNQFPEGDRGGNLIRLVGGENLHSRWDGLLGRRDLLADVDREVAELSDRMKFGKEWDSAKRETDVRKWVAESHELCKSAVYSAGILEAVRNTPPGADLIPIRLTDSYMRDAGTLARRRIVAAGLRLASLLDESSTTGESSPGHRYPSHWWTPVSDKGVPDWEILPQAAGPGEVILSKRNELGLLSNFAATPFAFHGKRYASLEGFWQMMKYPEGDDDPRAKFPGLEWPHTRDEVAQLTAFEAKKAGDIGSQNMRKMGIDWVTFEGKRMTYRPEEPGEHYRLIVEATWEKVRQNPKVKQVLLSTGDLVLKPDHRQERNAPAAWRYFDILTEIRSQLQRTE